MPTPPSIDAWGGGGWRVSGVWRAGSLLIVGGEPRPWRPASVADITVADLAQAIAVGAEAGTFVLMGTGALAEPPPRIVREALAAASLGLEFMSSEAAARLHNLLAAEGRLFATALIAL